jgi:DNA-binding transcriptional ArsR family regulator
MSEHSNLSRLLEAGLSAEAAVRIAVDAAAVYDRNRKPRGAQSGAIGMTGRQVFETLCQTPDYDPDIDAFFAYRPFTTEALAERIRMTRGAVGSAVSRLIEHGFIEKCREGRHFSVKLDVPAIALSECAQHYLEYGNDRAVGETILRLFPSQG